MDTGDVMPFVPCSPKHKACSRFHADMVREYQRERERQETALDEATGAHAGDVRDWKSRGGQLITFGQWLRGHRSAR
jgi:hypothetical protein